MSIVVKWIKEKKNIFVSKNQFSANRPTIDKLPNFGNRHTKVQAQNQGYHTRVGNGSPSRTVLPHTHTHTHTLRCTAAASTQKGWTECYQYGTNKLSARGRSSTNANEPSHTTITYIITIARHHRHRGLGTMRKLKRTYRTNTPHRAIGCKPNTHTHNISSCLERICTETNGKRHHMSPVMHKGQAEQKRSYKKITLATYTYEKRRIRGIGRASEIFYCKYIYVIWFWYEYVSTLCRCNKTFACRSRSASPMESRWRRPVRFMGAARSTRSLAPSPSHSIIHSTAASIRPCVCMNKGQINFPQSHLPSSPQCCRCGGYRRARLNVRGTAYLWGTHAWKVKASQPSVKLALRTTSTHPCVGQRGYRGSICWTDDIWLRFSRNTKHHHTRALAR